MLSLIDARVRSGGETGMGGPLLDNERESQLLTTKRRKTSVRGGVLGAQQRPVRFPKRRIVHRTTGLAPYP
jgi:hypothetical protein